jgi:hypothetical protein
MGSLRSLKGSTYVKTEDLQECLGVFELSSIREMIPLLRDLKAYRTFGDAKSICEALDLEEILVQELARYKATGSVESIQEVFSRSLDTVQLLRKYQDFGNIEEIKKFFYSKKKGKIK